MPRWRCWSLQPGVIVASALECWRRFNRVRQRAACGDGDRRQQTGQREVGAGEADPGEQGAADEEAEPLHRVLGTGEPSHPFEELSRPLGGRSLDRRLGRGLGDILGEP